MRQTSRCLMVALLIILIGGLAAVGQTPQKTPETVVPDPFQAMLGADDGAALILHYGGDTRGNIDTCG